MCSDCMYIHAVLSPAPAEYDFDPARQSRRAPEHPAKTTRQDDGGDGGDGSDDDKDDVDLDDVVARRGDPQIFAL